VSALPAATTEMSDLAGGTRRTERAEDRKDDAISRNFPQECASSDLALWAFDPSRVRGGLSWAVTRSSGASTAGISRLGCGILVKKRV
jgi:hypothetical protein